MRSSWHTIRRSVELVRNGWDSFHKGAPAPHGVRLPVLRSWERSLQAGIQPGHLTGGAVWSYERLQEERLRNSALLSAAGPVISDLQSVLAGSGHVLVLCDAAARVLMMDGAPSALRAAESIGLAPGSDWHEQISGTNAMGTALAEQSRVTIFATEHYVENLHLWSCVAAPIRHPLTGEVLGIFDVSGRSMTVTAHTEMAVLGAVQAIEARLAFLEATYRHTLLEAYADRLARGGVGALYAVDRFGQVVRSTEAPLPAEEFWCQAARQVCLTDAEHRVERHRPDGRRTEFSFRPVRQNGMVVGALAEAADLSRAATPPAFPGDGLVGRNPAWLGALERAARVARTDSTLLIAGETGTGKEVLARAVHKASSRAGGPFVAINCGAIPPHLVASELFGHVAGAFTGANPRGATGKVEAANGGTLFLDEVSELPAEAQVSLLRVLQEREVVRVGSHHANPVNVRVIAASNRNLADLVAAGTFRQDLFFRLNVVPLRLPPLRERREDILPLLEFGYRRFGAEPPALSLASCEKLTAYAWPGNVRELLNLVEQAVALGEDPADLLPLAPLPRPQVALLGEPGEEGRIRQALDAADGNAAAAARALGMSRSTLYRKLELYEIRLGRQVK